MHALVVFDFYYFFEYGCCINNDYPNSYMELTDFALEDHAVSFAKNC